MSICHAPRSLSGVPESQALLALSPRLLFVTPHSAATCRSKTKRPHCDFPLHPLLVSVRPKPMPTCLLLERCFTRRYRRRKSPSPSGCVPRKRKLLPVVNVWRKTRKDMKRQAHAANSNQLGASYSSRPGAKEDVPRNVRPMVHRAQDAQSDTMSCTSWKWRAYAASTETPVFVARTFRHCWTPDRKLSPLNLLLMLIPMFCQTWTLLVI